MKNYIIWVYEYYPNVILFPVDVVRDMFTYGAGPIKTAMVRYESLLLMVMHLNWDPSKGTFEQFIKETLEDEDKRRGFNIQSGLMVDFPLINVLIVYVIVIVLALRFFFP